MIGNETIYKVAFVIREAIFFFFGPNYLKSRLLLCKNWFLVSFVVMLKWEMCRDIQKLSRNWWFVWKQLLQESFNQHLHQQNEFPNCLRVNWFQEITGFHSDEWICFMQLPDLFSVYVSRILGWPLFVNWYKFSIV